MLDHHNSPSLTSLFLSFLKLGATAFGGPAMVPYIGKMAVEQRKWLDEKTFRDGVALCQTIPGATAMQTAAYVGFRTRGVGGAAVSFIGFGLPAFLLMVALSDFYVRSHALPPVVSVFNGLQTIIVAIVANATVSFGKTSLQGFKDVMIAAVAAGMFATGISPIMVIILAALLGLLIYEGNSVERRGHWLGFTAARRARVEMLFQQWGVLTVLLSRSLLSFLSSAVNLLAGASRYWLRVFLVFAIVGRLIWTLAYLGLGYGFGVGIEAAAEFPSSVSGLLASLAAVAGLGFMIYRDHARISAAQCQPNAGPG